MLHGQPGSGSDWRQLADQLPADLRVVALDRPVPTGAFYDWDWLCALLAAQPPSWPPGTAHGESALFYGHLVGDLVRRVDGRSVGRFLAEDILQRGVEWMRHSVASSTAGSDCSLSLSNAAACAFILSAGLLA